MDFYVYLNGACRGPFSEDRLHSFLADGLLQADDLASEQSDGGWKPLREFRRFTATPQDQPSPMPPPLRPTVPPVPLPRPQPTRAAELCPVAPGALGAHTRSTLAPNETAYFRTTLHWIVFVRYGAMAAAALLFAAVPFAIALQAVTGWELGWFSLPLPAFIMVPPAVAFWSSELVVTDRRVLIKTGVIRRQTVEMFIVKVESIAVDQGFLGRVFDYGTVTMRGTGGFEEAFEGIARPVAFRSCVQRLQGSDVPTPNL
ncbi:MAG: PH domain-containing protein [Chthoniobacterales bacterium]